MVATTPLWKQVVSIAIVSEEHRVFVTGIAVLEKKEGRAPDTFWKAGAWVLLAAGVVATVLFTVFDLSSFDSEPGP